MDVQGLRGVTGTVQVWKPQGRVIDLILALLSFSFPSSFTPSLPPSHRPE